ncbi:hypothetical protein X975_23476, partial [Stegodyphus mimosarum]
MIRQPRVGPGLHKKLFPGQFLHASIFHILVFKTSRSISRESNYLRFGLPFFHVPVGLALKTSAHFILWPLMKLMISGSLYEQHSSKFDLLSHTTIFL